MYLDATRNCSNGMYVMCLHITLYAHKYTHKSLMHQLFFFIASMCKKRKGNEKNIGNIEKNKVEGKNTYLVYCICLPICTRAKEIDRVPIHDKSFYSFFFLLPFETCKICNEKAQQCFYTFFHLIGYFVRI